MSLLVGRTVEVNGIRLHARTAGPEDGPMVLMLHGFPEYGGGWHRTAGPLAEAGYFVVAPDQRGYGLSDKPARVSAYAQDVLTADAVGLIDAFSRDKAHVVCHDWGGVVGWWLALDHADRVASFCVMNMPHPGVMAKHLTSLSQLRRSWYIFALQLPFLPERRVSKDNFDVLVRTMFANTVTKPFDADEIEAYREAWRQEGAVKGMIAWYRAAVRYPFRRPTQSTTDVPALMIWGKRDRALGFEMAEPSMARCTNGRLLAIDEAGHFVQHDAPAEVNAALLAFLAEVSQ